MPRPSKNESRWKGLREYWESYGHSVSWEDLIDFKERSYDGLYVVLAWDAGEGMIGVADIAGTGERWEMQNDSEQITSDQWKKLRIVPDCDWYRYPGSEES